MSVLVAVLLSAPLGDRSFNDTVTVNDSRIFVSVTSSQNPQLGETEFLDWVVSQVNSVLSLTMSFQKNLATLPDDRLPSNSQSIWPSVSVMEQASAPFDRDVMMIRGDNAGGVTVKLPVFETPL